MKKLYSVGNGVLILKTTGYVHTYNGTRQQCAADVQAVLAGARPYYEWDGNELLELSAEELEALDKGLKSVDLDKATAASVAADLREIGGCIENAVADLLDPQPEERGEEKQKIRERGVKK